MFGKRLGDLVFSIIIATRDRPELLARALRSVMAQRYRAFEVLLIDDSSTAAMRARNAAVLAEAGVGGAGVGGAVLAVPAVAGGSGPGDARNRGLAHATQPYVAFLDDDDEWTDPAYLEAAAAAIGRLGLDLHFADQEAVRADGSVVPRPVWAEDLADKLPAGGAVADGGTYRVSVEQVLLSDGFAHLNTTIVRRSLAWERLGGFDGEFRYEEDRDFYLRVIDVADAIGYTPGMVARHHVPAGRASASSVAVGVRDAGRLAVLDKAIAGARSPAVRARCRRDRVYTLKKMSARAAVAGEFSVAIRDGRAALREKFGAKWAVFVAGLYVRRAFSRRSQAG